ncbi:LuxR C-terminal-related transcriptional regulator [Bacteroidota bacterium]
MIGSTNMIVSLINLFSLILGGFAIGLIFRLSRKNNIPFLNYYLFFLICAVVSGFCDWIIFNWIFMLVPGISMDTADFIYHIFWDLIGFPSAMFALYFLIRTLNSMLKLRFSRLYNLIFIYTIIFIIIFSYVGFYFRLNETPGFLPGLTWTIFFFIIPLIKLSYLAFVYYISLSTDQKTLPARKFILILFFSFLLWHFLSFVPIRIEAWQHMIIFTYYLAIFLPAVYLFIKQKNFQVFPKIPDSKNLEDVFTNYNFTPREKELMFLILEGKSNKDISEELFISLQTVKNYISKIYKKIGLKNRVQFVNFVRKYSAENTI